MSEIHQNTSSATVRRAACLSLVEVAAASGHAVGTIQRYERDATSVRPKIKRSLDAYYSALAKSAGRAA